MNKPDVCRQWLAAKSGVVDESDLIFVREERRLGDGGRWYKCQCGIAGHVAFIPWDFDGLNRRLGDVMTCFVTEKQWLIHRANVCNTIRDEEVNYIELLKNAPKVTAKAISRRGWSDETKAFLADTHGIDQEVSQAIVDGTWPHE